VHKYVAKSFCADAREGAYVGVALGGFRKRAVDIAVTSIALIVLMPILLATAGLVRLLVGKGAIEADQRIGFGGKAFAAYQFYSGIGDHEDTSAPLWLNGHSWAESFGGALRASGLDKLPLLFNILRGDMSLIGPRPITPDEFSRYHKLMPEYFTARPGLTGLWRHSATLSTQMALDRYYIRYWSVGLDLTLLIKAISAVV